MVDRAATGSVARLAVDAQRQQRAQALRFDAGLAGDGQCVAATEVDRTGLR